MKNFKYTSIAIVILLAWTGYFYFKNSNNSDNKALNKDKEAAHSFSAIKKNTQKIIKSAPYNDTAVSKTENLKKSKSLKSDLPEVSYSMDEVFKLSDSYPEEKERLLAIAKSPNPFLEQKITVNPHTTQDIKQEELGAIKVMAIRVILEKEKSKATILNDLSNIIREAQDPTIVAIAESMQRAVKNNRDFSNDYIEAINNMPIDDDPHDKKSNKDD